MTIHYYIKQVYGKDMIYIVDPVIASNMHYLTGKKTLSFGDIETLQNLGFELVRTFGGASND